MTARYAAWVALALLISPEFEGIKTPRKRACMRAKNSLLISPEFEGIKTSPTGRNRYNTPLLISPEFEGIKTHCPGEGKSGFRATDQPRIRGD